MLTICRWKVFLYVYAGLIVPTISFMSLGAVMGGAIKSVPAFSKAYTAYGGGGVALEMLSPAGGFSKFVAFILAFSVIGDMVSLYPVSY
jgi:purine-cytosine permease-like protein